MKFIKPNIEKPDPGMFMVCRLPDGNTGIVKVLGSAWYTSEKEWNAKPRGELLYYYSYNRTFPQVLVKDACGRNITVNGNDLLENDLRALEQKELIYQKYYEEHKLSDILANITVEGYSALNDPICSCCRNWSENNTTLLNTIMGYKNQLIINNIKELLDKPAVLYSFEEMKSPGDSFYWPSAGFIVHIKNTANLYIILDGYRGDSIELTIF